MDYTPLDLGIPKLAAWLTVYGPEWNIPSTNGLIGNFHIIGTYWMDDKWGLSTSLGTIPIGVLKNLG